VFPQPRLSLGAPALEPKQRQPPKLVSRWIDGSCTRVCPWFPFLPLLSLVVLFCVGMGGKTGVADGCFVRQRTPRTDTGKWKDRGANERTRAVHGTGGACAGSRVYGLSKCTVGRLLWAVLCWAALLAVPFWGRKQGWHSAQGSKGRTGRVRDGGCVSWFVCCTTCSLCTARCALASSLCCVLTGGCRSCGLRKKGQGPSFRLPCRSKGRSDCRISLHCLALRLPLPPSRIACALWPLL
jgi:hypothetical protein